MPDQSVLIEIIQKIVEEVVPDKIILFGSRAKEEQKKDSDYDICVLKKKLFIRENLPRESI